MFYSYKFPNLTRTWRVSRTWISCMNRQVWDSTWELFSSFGHSFQWEEFQKPRHLFNAATSITQKDMEWGRRQIKFDSHMCHAPKSIGQNTTRTSSWRSSQAVARHPASCHCSAFHSIQQPKVKRHKRNRKELATRPHAGAHFFSPLLSPFRTRGFQVMGLNWPTAICISLLRG